MFIIYHIIGSIILAASIAFWAVTSTMQKNNDQGGYSDDNQAYMQGFDIEIARDEVDSHYNAHEFL